MRQGGPPISFRAGAGMNPQMMTPAMAGRGQPQFQQQNWGGPMPAQPGQQQFGMQMNQGPSKIGMNNQMQMPQQ